MSFATPNSNGWAKFPAPGGGGVAGGTGPEGWTNVDLTVANGVPNGFHPMDSNNGYNAISDWVFSNPSAGVLRIRADSGKVCFWQGTTQNGPILLHPTQIIPRTFTNPSGVTGNQWRSEDAILFVEMEFGPNGFLNDEQSNKGEGLGIGPILVAFSNSPGEGATLRSNNPRPPYANNHAQWGNCAYVHVRVQREGNPTSNVWSNSYSLGGSGGTAGNHFGIRNAVFGAPGQVNSLGLRMGGSYKNAASGRAVGAVASMFDSRVEDGTVKDQWEYVNRYDHRIEVERRYLYLGIAIETFIGNTYSNGCYLDITKFRYRVQPTKTTADRRS